MRAIAVLLGAALASVSVLGCIVGETPPDEVPNADEPEEAVGAARSEMQWVGPLPHGRALCTAIDAMRAEHHEARTLNGACEVLGQ